MFGNFYLKNRFTVFNCILLPKKFLKINWLFTVLHETDAFLNGLYLEDKLCKTEDLTQKEDLSDFKPELSIHSKHLAIMMLC